MAIRNGAVLAPETPASGAFSFEAADVTGTHSVVANDVQGTLPAGTVAKALASRLALPQNVPWSLRDETTSAFLDDDRAIADQLQPGGKVVLTPRAHLG